MTIARDQRFELRLRGGTYHVRVRAVEAGRIWLSSPENAPYPFPLPLGAEIVARPLDATPYAIARLPSGRRRGNDAAPASVEPPQPIVEVRGRLAGVRVADEVEIAIVIEVAHAAKERRDRTRRPHWEIVRIAPAAAREWTEGQLIEVSETGGRVRTSRPWTDLTAGQIVVLSTTGPSPLSLRAQIAWCRRRQPPVRDVLLGLRWMPGSERVVRRLLASFL